ncbi:ML domain-containing protein [Streptomyces sp. NPDC004980]
MTSWSWSDAGSITDMVEINGIDLKPDPPEPGEVVTVTIPVHISKAVERGAWIDVTVKLGAVELVSKTYNLFDRISEGDPGTGSWNLSVDTGVTGDFIEVGDAVLTVRLKIPREIPPARFAVEARARNADEHDLFALNIKVDFAY